MRAKKILTSRITRRSIFGVLIFLALLGPALAAGIIGGPRGDVLGFDSAQAIEASAAADALLLIWCAVFFKAEPVLARCALLYLALLHILLFAGLAQPVF